jgi:hypothetical protein
VIDKQVRARFYLARTGQGQLRRAWPMYRGSLRAAADRAQHQIHATFTEGVTEPITATNDRPGLLLTWSRLGGRGGLVAPGRNSGVAGRSPASGFEQWQMDRRRRSGAAVDCDRAAGQFGSLRVGGEARVGAERG